MPVDISLHPLGSDRFGSQQPAPQVPVLANQKSLADNVQSATLIVPVEGAVVSLTATTKLRVDFKPLADAGTLAPTNSGIVLLPDQTRLFSLTNGSWVLRTLAYA